MRIPPLLLGAMACAACLSEPPPTQPADLTGGGSEDGGGQIVPPLCRVPEDEPATESGADDADAEDDGFRFDVAGGGTGGTFPTSCDSLDDRTNLGCEFWAVDLPNEWRGVDLFPERDPAQDQQFAVVVANASAEEGALVEIVSSADPTAIVATATVDPNSVHTFPLPPLNINPEVSTTDGFAYKITSTIPITAYQFNPLDNEIEVYSNDASLLFPNHAAGREYAGMSGDAIELSTGPSDTMPVNAGAFISVVALEDGTDVTIDAGVPLVAGSPTEATLNEGRVFTVLTDEVPGTGNVSGGRVRASKPVQVFSGNVATVVPITDRRCCADHLEHQMPPIRAWGSSYAIAPPPHSDASGSAQAVYRIVAAYDDTELVYCPSQPYGAPDRLDAFQRGAFGTHEPVVVASADPNKPILVGQFIESTQTNNDPNSLGDPGMLIVPSIEQFRQRYMFAVPNGYARDVLAVVTRGRGDVTLNGTQIAASRFRQLHMVNGSQFYYAYASLEDGPQILNSNVPASISVFGYDEAVSYAFPGGTGLRIISTSPAG